MNGYDNSRGMRMLPQVAVATAVVMVVPVGLVWWLRAATIVTSDWLCVGLAIVASAVLTAAGNAYWKRREGSERVVFSELLAWSWIRRMRLERKLASVVELVSGAHARAELEEPDSERRGELLQALAVALDAQDPYTEGHSRRVARHAAMVARELHLPDDEVERVRAAAAVHDVGKLRVPAELLSKPGKLTPEEFEVVKGHATAGAALVAGLGDDELTAIVRHHHERFDGHGYPSGLAGTEIPLGARIVAVADTFDAITSIRSYRSATSHKHALDRLAEAAGTQLDPAAVRAFLRYYEGRKGSMAWVGLAVAPQRLVAWLHGSAGAAGNFALVTIASSVAVGVAAMGAAASVGVERAALRGRSPALVAQRTHSPSGSTAGSGGSTLASPGRGATGSLGGSSAGRAGDAAPSGGSRDAAYVSLRASAPGARPPGSPAARPGSHSGKTPAGPSSTTPVGGSGAGAPGIPHTGQSHAPGGGGGHPGAPGGGSRPTQHGGSSPGPGGGSGPAQAGGSGPAPSGVPTPSVAAPVASAPGAAPSTPASSGAPGTPTSPAPPSSGSSGGSVPGGSSGPSPSDPSSPPPTTGPTSKDQCKGGGFAQWGFKNQGQCIAYVNGH